MTTSPERVIDAHHHLWNPQLRAYPWLEEFPTINRSFEPSELSAATAGVDLAGTVVVQASTTAEETDWLLGLAEASGIILGVVGWVDLQDAAVGDRLAELTEGGSPLVGIRHPAQDESDPAWLTRPDVTRGLRAVQAAGLPYDLLVREPQRAAALELVASMPELPFVLDHLGKPDIAGGEWETWREWLAALASHPHVLCKISGLVTEASWDSWREQQLERYVVTALELFGPERCMFGSDWPVSLLAAEYADVVGLADAATSGLSAAERHSAFHATAASFYGLA